MCQILAMNCNTPTDINFSFSTFRERGGVTDNHKDGFGISFFDGQGVRTFMDSDSSYGSPVALLFDNYPIRSKNVIAHIRKATQGTTSLANTHPFMREIWGEYWIFAHNGNIKKLPHDPGVYYRPVGDTDSETIFCILLNRLRHTFDEKPDDKTLFDFINDFAHEVDKGGLFNFVISNGKWLIARCGSLLHYISRKAPFGIAISKDNGQTIDFSKVTTEKDIVSVVTTIPLTDNEVWNQLAVGEILMFEEGVVKYRDLPKEAQYLTIEEGLKVAENAH